MISHRTWLIARRYVLAPLFLGVVLLSRGRRSGLLALGVAGAILMFFRDPERPLDPDPDVVYAAADGFVTDVEEAHEAWIPGGDALRISTFLSIHNVHVNRSPVEGSVTKMEEIAGKFVPAFLGGSKDQNRQNRIAIDGPKGHAGSRPGSASQRARGSGSSTSAPVRTCSSPRVAPIRSCVPETGYGPALRL
jgi:phosphatidylserine decarboxylase